MGNSIYTVILIEIVLLFCSGVLLLLNMRKSIPNVLLGVILCLFAYDLLNRWLFWTHFIKVVPFLLNSDIAPVAAIPPLLYYYLTHLLAMDEKKDRFRILHFIPAITGLCWYGLFQIFLRPPIELYLQMFPHFPYWKITICFVVLVNIQVLAYMLFVLSTVYKYRKMCPGDRGKHLRTIFVFLLCLIICTLLLIISIQMESLVFRMIIFALYGVLAVFYILFSFIYPEYTREVQSISKNLRKNPLFSHGRDMDNILKELDNLMTEEKVYHDPDLSLQTLSNQLNIANYHLSFILNESIGMNFRSFINHHRIREAKRLLEKEPDKRILEVAFDVGFNSKSTFNAIFKNQTGLSPSEYKRKLEF